MFHTPGRALKRLAATSFDLPNVTFGTANFGRIFSAKNPREMQFGAKFSF